MLIGAKLPMTTRENDGPCSPRDASENAKWKQVVSLVAGGANVEGIAAASADAAENGLERASQGEGLAHAFWLLSQIPQAARAGDFSERLAELGLQVSNEPTLLEIVAAFTRALDGNVR